MTKSKKHQDILIEKLKDHNEAVAYLNTAFDKSIERDEISRGSFLLAVSKVIEAHGGVSKLAEKIRLERRSRYKILSENRNPKWHTLTSVIMEFGLNLKAS
ncbi:MAG: transcriptional regulator [Simkaniaceae bacterium]|nr:transcriptional regulator [Simkaniaceae bacterium]